MNYGQGLSFLITSYYHIMEKESNRIFLMMSKYNVSEAISKWPDSLTDRIFVLGKLCRNTKDENIISQMRNLETLAGAYKRLLKLADEWASKEEHYC